MTDLLPEVVEPLKDDGPCFVYERHDEEIWAIDRLTGDIIEKKHISEYHNLPVSKQEHERLKFLNTCTGRMTAWKYSPIFCDVICQQIIEGRRITEICGKNGMPSMGTLHRWRAEFPVLNRAIELAKKARAEIYRDEIEKNAMDKPVSKEEAPGMNLKFKQLRYLAEKDNPDEYGQKTQLVGDKELPIIFNINTGIKRDKD